jgi:porin
MKRKKQLKPGLSSVLASANIVLIFSFSGVHASNQTSTEAVGSEIAGESLSTRETLTGDWGGSRKQLSEYGVGFSLELTEFYQGMFSGTGDDSFDDGGRADSLVNLDTEKLGLWRGGGINFHFTYRYGDLTGFRGGALSPVNIGSVLPLDKKDELTASSIYLSQRVGASGNLLIGKINAIDLLANDPFFGGWGIHRFMNLALVAPPSGVLPPVIMGAIFNYQIAPLTLTFMVYDPNDRTSDSTDDLFSDGTTVSLGATWAGEISGRASSINVTGIYSDEETDDITETLLPPEQRSKTKDESYNLSLKVSHLLLESSTVPGKGLGIYAKLALADGNPNIIDSSLKGGFAGHHIVPGRPNDSFGIGYFYLNFSNELQGVVAPVADFQDEKGVEVFYNFAVAPWIIIAADLQWVMPANNDNDDAWIGGLRANLKI